MKNLNKLRVASGLTQKELAHLLNITDKAYWSYESGRTEPNIETLIKLADYFNVSLDYLCGRQNKNLIFTDSLTETQKKLVAIIKKLTPDQALFALGYFSDMLKLPYSEVRPSRPF